MTTFHQVLAECPVCLNEETLTIWDSIDAVADPDLREKLLLKTLQSLECRNCGNSTLIAAPLTYRDDSISLLVECRPDLDRSQLLVRLNELQESDPSRENKQEAPFRRLTASMNDLIEKIHMREQHFDDRALEIVKLAVINQGSGESTVEDLRFVGVAGQELNFVMKLDEGWFQYALPVDAYTNALRILEQVDIANKTAGQSFVLVDRDFAREMLAVFKAAMSDREEQSEPASPD